MRKTVKKILAVVLVFAMITSMLVVGGGATESQVVDVAATDCLLIGEYIGCDAYLFTGEIPKDTLQVRFTDFLATDTNLVIASCTVTNTMLTETNVAPLSSVFTYTATDAAEDEKLELLPAYTDYTFDNCFAYFVMDSDEMCMFIISFAPSQSKTEYDLSFTVTIGEKQVATKETATKVESAYTPRDMNGNYDKGNEIDVYVVTVPQNAETATLMFNEKRICYNYDESANYLAGYLSGDAFMVGAMSVTFPLDSDEDNRFDFIQVQTPYDDSWNSTLLYVIAFRYEGEPLPLTHLASSTDIDEVSFINSNGETFDVFSRQDGTTCEIKGDNVVIHYVPSNKTDYNSLHWGSINDKQLTKDLLFNNDGTVDIILPKYWCGKMIQVAPIEKNNANGTTNSQYYLAVPAESKLPVDSGGNIGDSLAAAKKLAKNINDYYAAKDKDWWANNGSFWYSSAIASYLSVDSNAAGMSDEAKQALVNSIVVSLDSEYVSAADYAKAIIALSSMGYDAQNVLTVNKTIVNVVEKLKAVPFESVANEWYTYTVPYVLFALNEGSYSANSIINSNLDYIINKINLDSSYGPEGMRGPDGPAMMLAALGAYYNTSAEAKAAADECINALSTVWQDKTTGSFGNTNSDAYVIIGLCAVGINPDTDERFIKNNISLLDALLNEQTAEGNGFKYGTDWNDMATYQGFLALNAAINVMEKKTAYNPFDFSKTTKTQAHATSNVKPDYTPSTPSSENKITVYITVKTPNGVWLPKTSVEVPADSQVYHAFVKALGAAGFKYDENGARTGYVRFIENDKGKTLAEFDMGSNSGWLYKVNGVLPTVGLNAYDISNNADIVWYYVEDWTKDPDARSNAGLGGNTSKDNKEDTKKEENKTDTPAETAPAAEKVVETVKAEATVDASGTAKAEVKSETVADAVKNAAEKKADSIVIAPEVSGDAKEVKVELPKESVSEIAKSTDAALVIETDKGSVEVPNEVLKEIAEQADGANVEISVAVKSVEDAAVKEAISDKVGDDANTDNAAVAEITVTSGDKKITTFSGKMINASVSVDGKKGFAEGKKYLTLVISENGKRELLAGKCSKGADGKLNVGVKVGHLSTFVVLDKELKSFADAEAHWSADAVDFAVANGLMNGTSDTAFAPNMTLNRAMLVTILYRLAGSPAVAEAAKFTDVAAGEWYSDAVAWAAANGIVTGKTETTFAPMENITREQFATMLMRYCKFAGVDTAKNADLSAFTDSASISNYAKDALAWANASGIITGRTATTIAPTGSATRGEAATMLMRFMQM